ncbi:hypothetical protein B0A48_17243 [Cryoendolithus antarcticus]|uniref:Uncharacterized protein n=1 Tax=Cryoendolithus antarcticus TaxID=1507870 RepID=A0A1V8SDC0_9PEZI|nr:hypothetical protein B0A48_17243 [Cryoendolithus antarcticus]
MLEYMTETRTPRAGFSALANEHLEASRPLFAAMTGLAELQRERGQLTADTYNNLRDVLRQYWTNLTVLNKMVNKLLDDEHIISRLTRGIRLMFNEGELDKMKASLAQCRIAAQAIPEVFGRLLREIHVDTGLSMGYTALASVTGIHPEEQTGHRALYEMPTHPVRIPVDLTTVSRWKPKHTQGANNSAASNALYVALQEKNHKMIEHLLDSGVPANHPSGNSLIRIAINNHDLDSVRLLLVFGADVNASDPDDITPLYAATERAFYEAAQLLLTYGADPNVAAGPTQESPFALTLHHGRAHFALLYLKYGADPDDELESGDTPFIKAINRTAPCHLVDLMLLYEASVNKKNSRGETPLFVAINADRPDIVGALLEHGALPNLPGPKHMLWPSVHHPMILELLLDKGADLRKAPGVLELATSINSIEAVKILLKHGVDVNAKKDGIFTPLCTAIRDDREKLIDLLLASGADPNLPASEYPAFKCVTHHRAHLLPKLLAAGADADEPAGIVETAVAHNNQDALILLLNVGLDPDARDAAGHTALTTAITKSDLGYIEILLARKANAGVRGHDWPVNMAVKNPEILAKLLPHLATAAIPKGALELAVQANQLESVKLLLAAGVAVEDKNGGVFSPLTIVIREDRKEIFRYLLDEAGADPNKPGEHLPIIKAIRRYRQDDLSYIEHLLHKGADMNLMYRGWNAVLQALDKGDDKTLQLLAEMGIPDIAVKDDDGHSVLEIMRARGMKEEEQILTHGPKVKKTGRKPTTDRAR